jgi:DNA-binding winged helix-turn-helix (wHTH) protein
MPPPPALRSFGDYSFDSASGELKGTGGITRLQPQVAALLLVLIERAGTVVTRAELRARLWPETTVEFDDGLNFCIRQLRVALDDDANAPQYIETLPKRGYRFLAAVTVDAPGSASIATKEPVAVPIVADRVQRHHGRRASIAFVVLAVAAGAFVLWHPHRPGQRLMGRRVVLGVFPFTADTADPMMAGYRQRLFDQLTTDARAERAWDLLTPPASRATHVLSGSLTRDGNSVKLFVQLVVAGDQRKLWADDIVDLYAFAGNSTMTADRIEKSMARILGDSTMRTAPSNHR